MKTKTATTILTALIGLTLAACSAEDSKKVENATDQEVNEAGLMSTWKSPCQNASLDLFGLGSQTEDLQITDDLRKVTKYFDSNECSTASLKVEEIGSYENFDKQGDNYTLDLKLDSVEVTPLTEGVKDLLNTISFCGISDWAVDTARDVTASTSDSPVVDRCWTKTPRGIYDLVHIDGNQMHLGQTSAEFDKTTPDKRPGTIDTSVTYTK